MLDNAQAGVVDALDDLEEKTGFGGKCVQCGAAFACGGLGTLFVVIAASNSGNQGAAIIFGILSAICLCVGLGLLVSIVYQPKEERPVGPASYPMQPGRYPAPYPAQPAPYPVPYPPPPPPPQPVYPQYYPAYGPVRYV